MGYGTLARSRPRIQVYRGFDPMNPTTLTQTARPKADVTILSGMAVVQEYNTTFQRYEWDLATLSDVRDNKRTVYIAYQDSSDMDVRDGGLTGLSSSGDFEIQTAFFDPDAEADYEVDTLLTLSDDVALAGFLVPVDTTPAGVSATDYPVVGKVTRYKGPRKLQDPAGDPIIKDDSSTLAADSKVIVFQTGNFGTVTVPAA